MKKFLSIGEHVENYFLTSGHANRALTREQHDAQEELRAAHNSEFCTGDVMIPWDARERRDMTATGTTSYTLDQGGQAVATEVPEVGVALRRAAVLPRLGGRLFTGLRGNVNLPYGKGEISASWIAENAPSGDEQELLGSLSLSPKRVTASLPISSQLIIQGGPAFQAWIQATLMDLLAVEIERVAIAGRGASSEPSGILYSIDGNGSVEGGANGAAPSVTNLADLEFAVTGTNDAGRGPLGWLVSPKIRRKLRLTPYWGGSSDSMPIWSPTESDRLLGHPAGVTTAVPDDLMKGESTQCSPIMFGNFSEQITALWGPGIGLSFVTDRNIAVTGGVLAIVSAYVDCGVRNTRAFDAMKDALAA